MDVSAVVSTDIMEQVRALNADRSVHSAAPIVLAGGALETALRAAIEENGLVLKDWASISAYANLLYKNNVLTKQDLKDVTQMAGMRNDAAHGDFDAQVENVQASWSSRSIYFWADSKHYLGAEAQASSASSQCLPGCG